MTQAQIAALVSKAIAAALKPELKAAKSKAAHTPFDSQSAITAACKKRGYPEGIAKVNVLTYDKWLEKGRRPRRGEKALKVGTLRLFHEVQTDVEASAPTAA